MYRCNYNQIVDTSRKEKIIVCAKVCVGKIVCRIMLYVCCSVVKIKKDDEYIFSRSLTYYFKMLSNHIFMYQKHMSKFCTSCLTKCSRDVTQPIQSQFICRLWKYNSFYCKSLDLGGLVGHRQKYPPYTAEWAVLLANNSMVKTVTAK